MGNRKIKPLVLTTAVLLIAGVVLYRGINSQGNRNTPNTNVANATSNYCAQADTTRSTSSLSSQETQGKPRLHKHFLKNTELPVSEVARRDDAILLANAVILTSSGIELEIPEYLRAGEDPGAFIIQSKGKIGPEFRKLIEGVGGHIEAYVPNNAFLVRISADCAKQLLVNPQVGVVIPYHPWFKLAPDLLARAVENKPLVGGRQLKVGVFGDLAGQVQQAFERLDVVVLGVERSPFGPVFQVRIPPDALVSVASLPGVHWVEPVRPRAPANDLVRTRLGVAETPTTLTNYVVDGIELNGSGVLVAVVDSGVDASHPDLSGRVVGVSPSALLDRVGHGTHVAGIIAGSGEHSPTNVPGSEPGANFRGVAYRANLFSILGWGWGWNSFDDGQLQEMVARTNALISNNSWYYAGARSYDLAAACYDAAVRDALPQVPGSQPLVFVFSAGDMGSGNHNGLSGVPDSILSPATAKNVITVGALEQPREIEVELPSGEGVTNKISFVSSSDSETEVAWYSSRGNVGYWWEGEFGRFKPDVVAPGSWVVSTRSTQWDEEAYYNPSFQQVNLIEMVQLPVGTVYYDGLFIPSNAIEVQIYLVTNRLSRGVIPRLPICAKVGSWPLNVTNDCTWSGEGSVIIPVDQAAQGQDLYFAVYNNTSETLNFDVVTVVTRSSGLSDKSLALKALNDQIGPLYRFESGTSMAAAAVSGMLALMQQYFQTNGITVSPALMKALLINGARSLGRPYDLAVSNTINFQGWGLVNLKTVIRPGLANLFPGKNKPEASSIWVFDQDPKDRALATGDKWTINVAVAPEAQQEPLRITLVWTDPPGHPAVGVKLVNDLDLVVTNVDIPDNPVVYVGNNIRSTEDFTQPWEPNSTNAAPSFDRVNNVENVFIAPPLGTNYQITVIASQVVVNAVPENTNGVVQDFALVISCGDGAVTNALKISLPSKRSEVITNIMYLPPESNGVPILNQRVGANFPLTNKADGAFGQISQWRFYVMTNTFGYTNVAFITFMPPEIGLRRMAVRERDLENAARPEGDIDLYVSTDPRLLELHPGAIAAADKSTERGGTEYVVYSNSTAGTVYYVGVKCEDQQAVEFGFLGVFSEIPFSTATDRGTQIRAINVPVPIPDGSPDTPQAALVFGVNPFPMSIRRVVVNEAIQHESFGDILCNLSHRGVYAALHNHTLPELTPDPGMVYMFTFEDNLEMEARRSDGPGSLRDFVGTEAAGVWQLTVVDCSFGHTGRIENLIIDVERSAGTNAVNVTLLGGRSYLDFVDVPPNVTNMIIAVSGNTQPLMVSVRRARPPTASEYDKRGTVNPPGGELTLSIYDRPSLQPDRYYYEIFNPSSEPQNIRILVSFEFELAPPNYRQFGVVTNVPLKDNAVTYAKMVVTNMTGEAKCTTVNGLDVGLLISHPRVADLVITLISPSGTRAVLFENRGWLDNNGLGTFGYAYTNRSPISLTDFRSVPPGYYGPGSSLAGWKVTSGTVQLHDMFNDVPLTNKVLWLEDGVLSSTLIATGAPSYELEIVASHIPGIGGMVAWWPFDNSGVDIYGGHDSVPLGNIAYLPGMVGSAIYCDGVGTSIEVPPCPELEFTNGPGFTIEGWIYPSNALSTVPLIVWGTNAVDGSGSGLQVWLSGGFTTNGGPGCISVVLTDSNGTNHYIETVSNAVVSTNWQHIAITYQAISHTLSIYTNGVLANQVSLVTNSLGTNLPVVSVSGGLFFGIIPGFDQRYAGGLDEFALYKRPLSDCEIETIYAAGSVGKFGYSASTCPVTLAVAIGGEEPVYLTNGLAWRSVGVSWETNIVPVASSGSVPVTIWALDPNVSISRIALVGVTPTRIDGLLHFTDNTNLAAVPIKFADTPFTTEVYPPRLIVTNGFVGAEPRLYHGGEQINAIELQWNVTGTNVELAVGATPSADRGVYVALGLSNRVSAILPTVPGKRYRLEYAVRGPGAVSWWNGDIEPTSGRALDLLGNNHGELWNGAYVGLTTNALVGNSAIELSGVTPKIELGDPTNLALTNELTIEGWINVLEFPPPGKLAQIVFRGDFRQSPYYLALTSDGRLHLHLEGTNAECGLDLVSAAPVILSTNTWYHVAAVIGWDTVGAERRARLFVNGEVVGEIVGVPFLIGGLNTSYSPGLAIGNLSRLQSEEPFRGYMDELTIYSRALTVAEIRGIYAAGTAGKADLKVNPQLALARVSAYLDGVLVDDTYGTNEAWYTRTITFTAQQSNSVFTLESLLPGTLVADVRLFELSPELYYQPEQPLSVFDGECAEGEWTLEIWDTRAGPENTVAALLNWQLSFLTGRVGTPPVTPLRHAVIVTNTLNANGVHYYFVDVPQWVTMCTNSLLFSIEHLSTNVLPLTVLYRQDRLPDANSILLFDEAIAPVTATLSVTSSPVLVPGQGYYLAVTNPNSVAVDYAITIYFDVTWLQPCVPLPSFVGPAGFPKYFCFEVPTNYGSTGVPDLVAFRVSGVATNVTVVLNQKPPLPDLAYHDYMSAQPCTNDEIVVVVTNTTPYRVRPGVWYAGVFNNSAEPITFVVEVCFDTNRPVIIPLTNGVPFQVPADSELAAEPGPPRRVYYEFEVRDQVPAMLLELFDVTGDAKLVLQRGVVPGTPPYFAESYPSQTNWHQIVLRTNSALKDLRGVWYLGVYNRTQTNIGYTVRAVVSTNGYLESGYPMSVTMDRAVGLPGYLVLSWTSVIGERYDILYTSSLRPPINWQAIGSVVATTPMTTYVVPVPSTPFGVYRVMHVASAEGIQLIHGLPLEGTLWGGASLYFEVDVPEWAEFATNIVTANGPIDLIFNQNSSPYWDRIGSQTLLSGVSNGVVVLSTNSTPPLVPGRKYWLEVRNASSNRIAFTIQVDFDIVPLQEGVPVLGMIRAGKTVKYYQFDVTNGVTLLSFVLTNLSANADLVVKRGWPPPTIDNFDLGSFNPGTNREVVLVWPPEGQTNVEAGRWFIGVVSRDQTDVQFEIIAITYTNGSLPVLPVQSGQWIDCTNAGTAVDYYRFVVSEVAARVQFELRDMTGPMALVARSKMLPVVEGGLYDLISDRPGTQDEVILMLKGSGSVTLTPGVWYIGAVNLSSEPVTYRFAATEWFETGTPVLVEPPRMDGTNLCLRWNSLPGVRYVVEGKESLLDPIWTPVSSVILATGYTMEYCISLPTNLHFFRVRED